MSDSRAPERDVFLEEYSSDDAVRRYTARSAGSGIAYLLGHDYARVYTEALDQHLESPASTPLRILEFGCGGGMNVIAVVGLLARQGRPLEVAYGTDFSDVLLAAANAGKIADVHAGQRRIDDGHNDRVAWGMAAMRVLPPTCPKASASTRASCSTRFISFWESTRSDTVTARVRLWKARGASSTCWLRAASAS